MMRRANIHTLAVSTIALMATCACAARPARATPIQFRMTGKIDVVFQVGPLPSGIYQDAPFEAILSYDLATPDSQPDDPRKGFYATDGIKDNYLLVRAGPSEIRSKHSLNFWIGDDVDETQELFELRNDTFRIVDTEITTNFEVSRFSLMVFHWNDPTRSAFSSDALPTVLDPTRFARGVDPNVFTPPYIEVRTLQIDPRAHQFTIHAFVETIEVVPEPSAGIAVWPLAAMVVGRCVCAGRAVFGECLSVNVLAVGGVGSTIPGVDDCVGVFGPGA